MVESGGIGFCPPTKAADLTDSSLNTAILVNSQVSEELHFNVTHHDPQIIHFRNINSADKLFVSVYGSNLHCLAPSMVMFSYGQSCETEIGFQQCGLSNITGIEESFCVYQCSCITGCRDVYLHLESMNEPTWQLSILEVVFEAEYHVYEMSNELPKTNHSGEL